MWTASAEELRTRVTTLSWVPGDSPRDYPDGIYPAPTKAVDRFDGHTVLIGAVPSWVEDPTVTLHLASEIRRADGTTGRSVEVPTFVSPTEDRRLLYLVAFDPTTGVADGEGYAVTITGSNGQTITAGCAGDDVGACIALVADPVSDLPEMCAEFPPSGPGGAPYEGWWSSTPSAPDGSILTDPADWPPIMREHPQTAIIDTRTGEVLETFDRCVCGEVPDDEVPESLALPPDAAVVVDAVTGEILETMSPPASDP